MKQKAMMRGNPRVKGALLGVGVSIGFMVLFASVAAWLINGEQMDLDSAQWLAIAAQAIGTFAGVWVALIVCKEKMAIVTGVTTAGAAILLLCISMLVFANGFANMLAGLGTMAAGGLAACLIKLKTVAVKQKRRKMPFR